MQDADYTVAERSEVLKPGQPTLGELAATANNEHLLVLEAGQSMLEHAIAAGEALQEARNRVTPGTWKAWLDQHWRAGVVSAFVYMRIAYYREEVAASGATGIEEARNACVGLPAVGHPRGWNWGDAPQQAQEMSAAGVARAEIARVFGVSATTVFGWLNPESYAEKKRQGEERRKAKVAERRLLERARHQEAVRIALKSAPDPAGRAYEATTKMDQWLGQWRSEAANDEQRRAINEAHALRDKLMEALENAVRLGYVDHGKKAA